MKSILVSCENEQEMLELQLVLEELRKEKPSWKIILFDTSNIFKGRKISYDPKLFDRIYSSINPFEGNFKSLSTLEKLSIAIRNALLIENIFRKEKIQLFFTGVPLVFFRLAHIKSPRKPIYVTFVRSPLIQRDISHSLSDRLNRLSRKIPILGKLSIFNNWHSDFIVTIGALNREYFISRGIPESKIVISGPLFLDFYRLKLKKKNLQGKTHKEKINTVYLLSTAFKWHNDHVAHEEQKRLIEDFVRTYHLRYKKLFKLIFRPHPRDDMNEYQNIIRKYNITIDRSKFTEFTEKVSPHTVLISTLSTLNLEWEYLGGKSFFLTTPIIFRRYRNFYSTLNIQPVFSPDDALERLSNGKIGYHNFNNVFYTHKNGNVQFLKDFIIEILKNKRV